MSHVACRMSIILFLSVSGCVQRRLTIESEPTGAEVVVDFEKVGKTPVTIPFTFYGERVIELRKEGYETLRKEKEIPPPWYQYFPFEIVSELLYPGTIWDRRTVKLEMKKNVYDPAGLMKRAEDARAYEWKK